VKRDGTIELLDWSMPLRALFESYASIPDAEWIFFARHVAERRFARGDFLCRAGQADPALYFVLEGIVRVFYSSDAGEPTRNFVFERRFAGDWAAVLTGEPCGTYQQALGPVRAMVIPGTLLGALYDRHPCWERIGRRMAEAAWLEKEEKERRFRTLTPEAHYRLLLTWGSMKTTRVPLRHLASYLGVTPETLSRIRARLRR